MNRILVLQACIIFPSFAQEDSRAVMGTNPSAMINATLFGVHVKFLKRYKIFQTLFFTLILNTFSRYEYRDVSISIYLRVLLGVK